MMIKAVITDKGINIDFGNGVKEIIHPDEMIIEIVVPKREFTSQTDKILEFDAVDVIKDLINKEYLSTNKAFIKLSKI